MDTTETLRAELVRAVRALGAPEDVEPVIERPRDPAFGDWATNLAMVLAKPLGKKPRDLSTTCERESVRPRSRGRGSSTFGLPPMSSPKGCAR
jgi:arginyl-tRNA synthetase